MRSNPAASRRGARVLAGAIALTISYLLTVAITASVAPRRARPLFDSISPPPPYQWVKPPPQFATGNTAPQPASTDITFDNGLSKASVVATPDGQFDVNFATGAFPPRAGDTKLTATVTPLDPATLGRLGAGLAPDGNAYRLTVVYEPSGTSVGAAAKSGDVIMEAPHAATALLYSPDGRTWQKLNAQTVGGPTVVGATFTAVGYFVAASGPTAAPKTSSGGSSAVPIAVAAAIAVVVLGGGALWLSRRRGSSGRAARARQRRRR